VRVDLVLLLATGGRLSVLLEQRLGTPFRGHQVLPGASLRQGEALDEAAKRVLERAVKPHHGSVQQLRTYGDPSRDPRGHVLSVAYLGLVEPSQLRPLAPNYQLGLVEFPPPQQQASDEGMGVTKTNGVTLRLGFDHLDILEHAVARLRESIFHSNLGYSMIRPEFTLRELRLLHETVLDQQLNKDNFRRKIIATGRVQETGARQEHVGYRPAKLYRAVC